MLDNDGMSCRSRTEDERERVADGGDYLSRDCSGVFSGVLAC